jgi:ATP-dependent Lon protease
MTGEITLRGLVLPVGGIKDKVLAAHRFGVDTVILPKKNENDLDDLPEEVRSRLNFVMAERVDEVLAAALEPPKDANGQVQAEAPLAADAADTKEGRPA